VKKRLKIFLQVHGALLVGIFFAAVLLEHDDWFKERLEHAIKTGLSRSMQAPFTCTIKKLNLLSGEMLFEHIAVKDPQGTWSFSAPLMVLHFSWLSFFARGLFDTNLTFYKPSITSECKGTEVAIVDPFIAFIKSPSSLPIRPKECTLQQATAYIVQDHAIHYTLLFSSTTVRKNTAIATHISCADGLIQGQDTPYAQKMAGTISIDIPFGKEPIETRFHLTTELPSIPLPHRQVIVHGNYKDGLGVCEVYHKERLFHAKGSDISYKDGRLNCTLEASGDIATLLHVIPVTHTVHDLTGNGLLTGHIEYAKDVVHYSGTCSLKNVRYKEIPLKSCSIRARGDFKEAQGTLEIADMKGVSVHGSWLYKIPQKYATVQLELSKPYELSEGIVVEAVGSRCSITAQEGCVTAEYALRATYPGQGAQNIKGQGRLKGNNFSLSGKHNKSSYSMQGTQEPFMLASCIYKNAQGVPIIAFKKGRHALEGTINCNVIKDLVKTLTDYELSSQGIIELKVDYKPEELTAYVTLKDINIRIPYTYNMAKGAQATVKVSIPQRRVLIQDALIQLHKGKVRSLCSSFCFSSTGELMYAHIPVTGSNCLISWQKDFFGLLSGALTLIYEKNGYSFCKGTLTLEKSTLHSNLLSSKVQKDFVGGTIKSLTAYKKDINLDVTLQTRAPLEAKTGFLETHAHISLDLKGTLFNPALSGKIELTEGSLAFPYKPLYITGGTILVLSEQLDDPAIELHAKNKIKKYMVRLHVTGSLQQPKISFESSPSLQEEQIITLLLSGSEEGSLFLVMPNLIMQNMESLLFGSAESSSQVQRYLKSLLKPLKNVRIIPTLSDQTAEGKGVHGALEIDINNRLRAKVQNNLNLSEDTQVEVEYTVSDDISIKATKDDKGTVGGEVEMRWKF
jgi:hypothetical protein